MKVEFLGSYADKSITLTKSNHYVDTPLTDDVGNVLGVAESKLVASYEIKSTTPGDNYQTLSSIVDNAYPAPVKAVDDLTQVYHNYYVNGERKQKDTIEELSIKNNRVIIDYVPPTVNRIEYVNDSQEAIIKITTDDHPETPESIGTPTTGESNYYRTYSLVIDSTYPPQDADPYTLVDVHVLYGHLNHPLNESINYRNNYDIVSATLLDKIFNTYDTEVVGGCIINSDLSRYYLGNRIILPENAVLQVSEETSSAVTNLNIGRYYITDVETGAGYADEDTEANLNLTSDGYDFQSPQRGYLFTYRNDEEEGETRTRHYYFMSSYLNTSTQTAGVHTYDPFPPYDETDDNGNVTDLNYIMGVARGDADNHELVKLSAAYSSEVPESDSTKYTFTDYHDLILYPSDESMNLFPSIEK